MRIPLAAALVLACSLIATAAAADPTEATVFISLVGRVRVLSGGDRIRPEVLVDLPQVEVGTGSGFLVSSDGWVLTSHHVVTGGRLNAVIDGISVVIAIDVERIDVAVPGEGGGPPRRFTASVYASDTELDLAVLSIAGPNLPHVALGDSDVLATGDPVAAIGYPFGRELELGRSGTPDVPTVSMTSGNVSALRRADAGEIRFVQTSAPLNPGNSGGPIVDGDGYAVAVAQLAVRGGAGIGFGVPINLAKAYLRRLGLDRSLPDVILTLGPELDDDAKGVRLRIPDGFQDASPSRLRIEAGTFGCLVNLRIDRLASSLPLEQVENALTGSAAFERFLASGPARRTMRRDDAGRMVIAGFIKGTDRASGAPAAMQYIVMQTGSEVAVARYTGPADAMALSRSVFRDSLAAMSVRPLLTERAASKPAWLSSPIGSATPGVIAPAGWRIEPGAPSTCGGARTPAQSFSASPVGDFTVAFRAAIWAGVSIDVAAATRGCAAKPMEQPAGFAYASRADWFGSSYVAHGVLLPIEGGGLRQLEFVAPESSAAALLPLFQAWVAAQSARQ